MSFINIRIIKNDQTISIIFEEIHKADNKLKFPGNLRKLASDINFYHRARRMDAYSILQDRINFADKTSFDKACEGKQDFILFKANYKQEEALYKKTSFTFELSRVPHVALTWLACITTVFNQVPVHYEFLDHPIEDFLNKTIPDAESPSLSISLDKYFTKNMSDIVQKTLLAHILAISEKSEVYAAMRDAVKVVNEYYHKNNVPFIEILANNIQDNQLYAKAGQKTINVLAPLSERTNQLILFV